MAESTVSFGAEAVPVTTLPEQRIFQELTLDQIVALQEGATQAVVSSMGIVREGQWDKAGMGVQSKGEGVVTKYDFKSEDNGRGILRRHGGRIPVLGEERGLSRDETDEPDPRLAGLEERIIWITDMLDGSRPFANGAGTSTVICTAWDKLAKRFVATTIGHPQSGLVMEASNGQTMRWKVNVDTGERLTEPKPCRVWAGDLGGESSPTVLVENLQSFQKVDGQKGGNKRTVFTVPDLLRLQHEINDHMAPQNMGSNGWHYMMLAGIGERVAAMVTTSIGNPGDVAGIHLVQNAGAEVRAFHVNSKRELELVENPHDVIDPENPTTTNKFDIVIAGVNKSIADFTADALLRTFNRRLGVTI